MGEFRLDFEQTKHLATGEAVTSDSFSAGGYIWRVHYFPHGFREADGDKGSISLLFELMSKADVNAIVEAFITVKDGHPWSPCEDRRGVELFQGDDFNLGGWGHWVSQASLEKYYLIDGHVTFVCAIMVVRDSSVPVPALDIEEHAGGNITFVCAITVVHDRSIPVPPSDIKKHFSNLPGSTDVSFNIGDDELGDPPSEMMKQLLAAADRYGLDQLKLMCAQKLGDNVSVDTVAATLTCAEMYSCPELKNKCIDFFVNCDGGKFQEGHANQGFCAVGSEVSFHH
ncbi:hypothetical protein SETIT_6G216100v2 [Setaria italica]|uniref:MATH domain-containing protein n=1 Tax=Setaria italica TaxID=4555 RepID=A0A368RP32_SETIT|nr:hypothetical protein SETIT_6G216100v2 [Setaria italica]